MDNNKNSRVQKLVETVAAIAMSIGLLFGCFIIIKSIFFQYGIKDSEVNITAVLLAAGLLGNVLSYVLEKFVKETLETHFEDEIKSLINDQVKQLVDKDAPEIRKLIDDKVRDAIELNEREKYENQKIEKEVNYLGGIKDTVVVPVGGTYEEVRRNNQYVCPDHFSFKDGLQFIAFYIDKAVVGYGKIDSDYNTPIGKYKVFKIKEYIPLHIPHEHKGAFLQNKRYCNSEKLMNAKNTDDLI